MIDLERPWIPTPADVAHIQSIQAILSCPADAAISYALRVAASALSVHSPLAADSQVFPPVPPSTPIPPTPGSALTPTTRASETLEPDAKIVVHIDGASSGNPGPGGWAAILSHGGLVTSELTGSSPSTTNDIMELQAVFEALKATPSGATVEVVTDSVLVVGWLQGGFRRKEAAIADLCREIDPLIRKRTVTFTWVNGHTGHPMNERANTLARAAVPKVR